MSESKELSMAEKVGLLSKGVKEEYKKRAVKHAGRFQVTKDKRAQADGAVNNVKILFDKAEDVKYTFTLSANVSPDVDAEEGEEVRDMDDYDLSRIQHAFTEFLKTAHELI
jgi:hypothetical protein